ncbi:unnamed protein product [Rotaria sordida]|uniref:Uncharacterized protein n=1 Tax=Rotaria sordida TaxID=392033 RepID=A0A819TFD7_9BILA|nr:unnamed protein product [Rotaria sordida]CAF4073912.1 unnamed protein product [Rotaria sordida]
MVKNADYQLRANFLALHNLYPSWPNRRIASELQNSENPPSKPRYLILKIIKRTIERGTVEDRPRSVLYTDFSGSIRLIRPNNNKNDGIWAATADEIDSDNRNAGVQKFSAGVILWGGISSDGLYPRNAPFYFNEWLDKKCIQIGKTRRTLGSRLYSMFIQQVIAPTADHGAENCEQSGLIVHPK